MSEAPTQTKEDVERAKRAFSRQIAAAVATAMSVSDISLGTAAKRLGKSERQLRSSINRLLDGDGDAITMRELGELFWALDHDGEKFARPRIEMRPRQ